MRALHRYNPTLARKGRGKTQIHKKIFRKDSERREVPHFRIALTGGPCGGKSSSLDHLTAALTARGFDVLCVPEVPTLLLNGGCRFPGLDGGQKLVTFESALLSAQQQLEESFAEIAQSTKRASVLVMDRGLLDIAAYMPHELWHTVLDASALDEPTILARYELVLHLVTAADGAEEFYTLANNEARSETAEQARELDRKVRGAWQQHPRLRVIENLRGEHFKDKLGRATHEVMRFVDEAAEHIKIEKLPLHATTTTPPVAPLAPTPTDCVVKVLPLSSIAKDPTIRVEDLPD